MPFVVSEGSVRALDRAAPAPALTVRLADDYNPDYSAIYRTQPSVRTVVSFLARNIASLGLHGYRRVSDTDRERVTDHPVVRLLAGPNPRTTPYKLMLGTISDLCIYDSAHWLKIGSPAQRRLVRIPAARVKPVGDNWLFADEWEITGTRGKKRVPADGMVSFIGYHPDDARIGCSPIESLRRCLAEEHEAGLMREQMWRNGARFSGYLERPMEAPAWSHGARTRFRRMWAEQYTGGGPESGGTPILEDGMKFVPAGQSAQQLQYVEARKLTREEVAAAYHVQPTAVGIMDHANFANVDAQHRMTYQDTFGPTTTDIAQEIALQLLPDFPDTTDMYLEFNLAEKLRGSFEEQAGVLQTATGAPYLTRNEARARLNLPSTDGGDELVTPLNVLIGGQASPTDSAPPPAGP